MQMLYGQYMNEANKEAARRGCKPTDMYPPMFEASLLTTTDMHPPMFEASLLTTTDMHPPMFEASAGDEHVFKLDDLAVDLGWCTTVVTLINLWQRDHRFHYETIADVAAVAGDAAFLSTLDLRSGYHLAGDTDDELRIELDKRVVVMPAVDDATLAGDTDDELDEVTAAKNRP